MFYLFFLGGVGGGSLDSQREGENITHSLLTKFPGKAVEWSLISGNFPKLEGFFLKKKTYILLCYVLLKNYIQKRL